MKAQNFLEDANSQNNKELEDITLEWLHEQHKASHSDTGFRLWARTFLMRHYNIDVDSVSYIMHALNA